MLRTRPPRNQPFWGIFRHLFLAVGSTLLVVMGCDPSVQALKPSDEHRYSVFGILNPVQDTQWIRVEPLPPLTSEGAPRTLDVTVTLENLTSGQNWALRDSVMEVFRGEPQHNFWTTAPVEPGAQYRLTVANEEGDTTEATTTTPTAPPDVLVKGAIYLPCVKRCPPANTFEVVAETGGNLAAMRVRYFQSFSYQNREKIVTGIFDWYDEVERRGRNYSVRVNYLEDLQTLNRTIGRLCNADSARVITAVGGPDWPAWAEYHGATISEVARPDTFTNVQGGHGMFSGVYTDTSFVETRPRIGPRPDCSRR